MCPLILFMWIKEAEKLITAVRISRHEYGEITWKENEGGDILECVCGDGGVYSVGTRWVAFMEK